MNVDGANYKEGYGGMGTVIRNHHGDVLATMARKLTRMVDAGHIEAMSICHGMQLAKNLGLEGISVESNCAPLMSKLQILEGGVRNLSLLGHIFYYQ